MSGSTKYHKDTIMISLLQNLFHSLSEIVRLMKLLDVSINHFMIEVFLRQPHSRIHSLLVLATFASHCGSNENLQTVIVTNSLAIQTLCEEGNIHAAELLQNECEEIISRLGEECRAINRYVFSVAKSQLFLCKGLYNEGWQLVKAVLDEAKGNVGTTTKFVLVKAKLLCVRYLSLPTSVFKASLEDADGSNYFDYLSDSMKYAEALVKHFVENGAEVEGLNNQKKERAVFLSHWSLLSELSCCFVKLGKVYLLQGAFCTVSCFHEKVQLTTQQSHHAFVSQYYVILIFG
ncbi:Hypothetical predicted protein [Paramuricea clavata]|uniref:Uncharacterized protein n=1 Tax=Paramuricea clavata TaxID=317549 RepID=A0A7D9DH06_PARCT|nr:Hypothetical predicted protein [Paramuricea clavata]